MKVIETALQGVLIIEPPGVRRSAWFLHRDLSVERYRAAGITLPFVHDNHSRSPRGVLRGLHFQRPRPQSKLVSVNHGAVYDPAEDINSQSPTCGQFVCAS